jgi:hypothetical protein
VEDGQQRRRSASPAVAGGSGFVAADVPRPVRSVLAVQGDPRGDPARGRWAPVGVLPGGVAVQVRQQALHAVNQQISRCANFEKEKGANAWVKKGLKVISWLRVIN